ncbi:hypothetical protein [Natrononativus amylolyticus]|uniref:hypothetical protein n=1 Tax=Natrononativus amylolyticus TaxID=2963434 RepID=UPI0020CC4D29|nr:hypothetical protein [Natrononativus amylolyticus]
MLTSPSRGLAIVVCLGALLGLFVWFGALEPAPDRHHYPGGDELVTDAERYVGQDVETSGTVVGTDPVRIEVNSEYGTTELRVVDAPPVEKGQNLRVFGPLTDETTVVAEGTLVRDSWEFAYMYGISALAALWVLLRAIRHWRLDPSVGVVPRDRPLTVWGLTIGGADASSEDEYDG